VRSRATYADLPAQGFLWAVVALAAAAGLILSGPAAGAGAGATGSAVSTVKPPAGIPDLSKMALAVSDLATGAGVARQGYVKPTEGVVASYEREFRPGTRLGGKRLLFLGSSVDLMRSLADAKDFMEFAPLGFALLDPEELAAELRSDGVPVRYVRIGQPTRMRAGHGGFTATIRVGTRAGEMRFVAAVLRVDRIISYLSLVGVPGVKVGASESTALSRIVSRHIVDGLTPLNTALPTITGTAQVGQTLTAAPGTWTNKPTAFLYQWQRCDAAGAACAVVSGATGRTYTLTTADAGSTVSVAVIAGNAVGKRTAISAVTTIVAAEGAPASTAPPTISGTVAVGQTLTADPGSWTGSPTSFTYQWRRCDAAGAGCTDIAGATSQTYTVDAADKGFTLRVAVTATNAAGSTPAISARTAAVP
jgi:hypothetical protein